MSKFRDTKRLLGGASVGYLFSAARTPRGAVGLLIASAVMLVALLGPIVSPLDPNALVTMPFAPPSADFPLGADNLGRDVLSRAVSGGRELLVMAVLATVAGVALGALAGIAAGYGSKRADSIIMRIMDIVLAFPQLVLALLLLSIIGGKAWIVVLAVAVSHAPAVARVLRASTLDIAERDYVRHAELQGVGTFKIITTEILPNLVTPLMVETGIRLTYSIVVIGGLAFLGFGLPPTHPNWSYMIQEDRLGLVTNPWAVVVPALLLALLAIGVNTFTDAVSRVAIGVDRTPEEMTLLEGMVVT